MLDLDGQLREPASLTTIDGKVFVLARDLGTEHLRSTLEHLRRRHGALDLLWPWTITADRPRNPSGLPGNPPRRSAVGSRTAPLCSPTSSSVQRSRRSSQWSPVRTTISA